MIARRLAAALLLLAACDGRAGSSAPATHEPTAAELARALNPPTAADREAHDYPSLAVMSHGEAWLADIHWDGRSDGLELGQVSKLEDATENKLQRVYTSPTRLLFTAAAADGADALHVLFCEQGADGWALREQVQPKGAGGDAAPAPRTLRSAPGHACVEPALAVDPKGSLLATWVETGADGLLLWAASNTGGGWSAPIEVSGQRASNWSPSVCASGAGRFAIAWDAAVDGDYDVQLARLELGADGAPRVVSRQRVTDTPRFEAHASITASGDRLYVAYDVAPEHWGLEGSTNKLDEALHSQRTIEIVAIEGDQVAPLVLQPTAGMNESLARNCEQPHLVAEGTGALLLMFRGLPLPREVDDPDSADFQAHAASRTGLGVGWRTSIWITLVTRLDGAVWGLGPNHHIEIPESKGRCDSPVALVRRPAGGEVFAASGDGRTAEGLVESPLTPDAPLPAAAAGADPTKVPHTWWQPVTTQPTRIVTRLIKKEPLVRPIGVGAWHSLAEPRTPAPRVELPQHAGPGGASLSLALGDLHRHTDISRCSSNWDGPISDALRYAWDVAPLDFLAITDHFDHMTKYDWWRTVAQVDAWNAPGRMTGLRAYERADLSTGHRNVISADGDVPLIGDRYGYDPLRDAGRADTPADLWPLLAGGKVLTIPHTPAGMTPSKPEVFDWSTFNPAFDRAIEIFQSYRGSSEAADAPRAIPGLMKERYVLPNLDLGLHFGLVAGSDHQTSFGAFTGAWVTDPSRQGVFDALYARRTFATSVRASLWTEWAGVPLGGSAPAPAGPATFHVEVDGLQRPIATIELISDGGVVATRHIEGGASATSADFPLDPPQKDSRYAYARVTFADGELMWSSPIRLYAKDQWPGPDGPTGKDLAARVGDVWKLTTDPSREKIRAHEVGH